MADYLLEIGCEEIPARMVDRGVADLAEGLTRRLESEGLKATAPVETFGGPRRLAVLLRGIPPRQPDRSERIVGPPADRAFDGEGKPTKAATSFAQKLGIEVEKLERVATAKGVCLAGVKETKGEDAAAVLARIVPEVVRSMTFAKMMRWGSSSLRFVRAIRSLVSLLDDRVVDLEIAGVRAGRASFGHRFLGARSVPLARPGDYAAALRAEHVLVEPGVRRKAIESQLLELATAAGGSVDEDEQLLAEVVHLVEEPHVVHGRFDPAYLDLPAEVLVTSIKHHQKGFPVWSEARRTLAPAILAVANVPDIKGHVARGCERVLNARLADARFFWREDRKSTLASRLPKLDRVVFHEKLGSYRSKVGRLATLAPAVAGRLGFDRDTVQAAGEAAMLCKADLVTGMVGEFPELQGVMGGLYLKAEGASPPVARAVYEHYRPLSLDGEPPDTDAGSALAIADKLDTLVGFFGVGLIPSGTKDPYGLRRAAQGLLKTLLAIGQSADLDPLIEHAARLHQEQPGAAEAPASLAALRGYLRERVDFVLASEGHRADTIECVLAVPALDVVDAARRTRALTTARVEPGFEEAFTVFKRVANIAGTEGDTAFDAGRFNPDERALAGALARVEAAVRAATAAREYSGALASVRDLAAPLNHFFEAVFVMDPDLDLRENRLRLLRAVAALVRPIGDFSKLQVEREGRA